MEVFIAVYIAINAGLVRVKGQRLIPRCEQGIAKALPLLRDSNGASGMRTILPRPFRRLLFRGLLPCCPFLRCGFFLPLYRDPKGHIRLFLFPACRKAKGYGLPGPDGAVVGFCRYGTDPVFSRKYVRIPDIADAPVIPELQLPAFYRFLSVVFDGDICIYIGSPRICFLIGDLTVPRCVYGLICYISLCPCRTGTFRN